MEKPNCQKCKVSFFVAANKFENKVYFTCGLCGEVWSYDSILYKKVAERDVGRILGKILVERAEVYRKELQQKERERQEIQATPMSMPFDNT